MVLELMGALDVVMSLMKESPMPHLLYVVRHDAAVVCYTIAGGLRQLLDCLR